MLSLQSIDFQITRSPTLVMICIACLHFHSYYGMDAYGVCSTHNPKLILKYMALKDIRLRDGKSDDVESCNCNLQDAEVAIVT
ncbi:hypothetical protein SLE2022_211470 [Rubroshorea leprosula]